MWVQIYPNTGLSSVCNDQRKHTIWLMCSKVMWRDKSAADTAVGSRRTSCEGPLMLVVLLQQLKPVKVKKNCSCVWGKKSVLPAAFVFVFPALHPGVWRHHRHPAHPGWAALHKGQQRGQKSAHLHHLLRFGVVYAAANNLWDKVVSFRSGRDWNIFLLSHNSFLWWKEIDITVNVSQYLSFGHIGLRHWQHLAGVPQHLPKKTFSSCIKNNI